ncbi:MULTISPECIES: sugar-binding transcriptional regulator [Halomonas]|mgnify:FL=1|uniref:Sugar-binding transcriptional regulator n=3 Tax=Halomonas TaxID=2745 RepID=A0AAU7KG77_9GAMM|nr:MULTISPECIES: sugar-binding transcriptional regulator [Halomonas]MBR9771059.1 sugar-binding transcriptional regulator [Gammaproteobacteria bacterium]MCO7217196.1 sugar-binding transcriptional regulator [Halomonas sp. OfavH-34-E]KJZ06300.1 DeoR faimly transcriptional regulator [Halomonas sp. S2151]MAR74629.1 DNA-binding transcriptional regulator [Halomonas sp.]MBR9881127.1 sugar-binding transcriptional regulator [Gammaproteobacteria bacterium]
MDKFEVKLDQAARAAWLSYVGGQTQDEIAAQLGVSRPGVQRLLALARQEGLVKVHIDHPVAHCTALSQAIRERFELDYCDVVPASATAEDSTPYLAVAGAERLSRIIERSEPQTLSLGSGRSIRATVEALSRIDRPRHRFVSLVGNVARDGSSNRYDGVMVAADKTGGERYLLPTPVVASSVEEKRALAAQPLFRAIGEVAEQASAAFVGVGRIDRQATLFQDHFISESELDELLALDAVGELVGWPMDADGRLIDCSTSQRVTSLPLTTLKRQAMVAVAGGRDKGPAILAALRGGWLTSLITDDQAARYIVERLSSQI